MPNYKNNPVVSVNTSLDKPAIEGESRKKEGVRGVSHSGHAGVIGINQSRASQRVAVVPPEERPGYRPTAPPVTPPESSAEGNGGWFESGSGEGVRGWSKNVRHGGVVGVNTAKGIGVFGTSDGEGVHGQTTSKGFAAGVTGMAVNKSGMGAGVLGQTNGSGPGVVGKANKDAGVIGFHGDPRLRESPVVNDGSKAGVFGASENGAGVLGYSPDPDSPAVFAYGGLRALAYDKSLAGYFIGKVQVDGNIQVNGDIFVSGADCAEHFDLAQGEECGVGTVMVIEEGGTLKACAQAYDKKAAGVVSGAGKFKSAIILDKRPTAGENRLPIALIGKVYCKVDARFAPVGVGDMLTTSPTAGHAMKADDPHKAFGAVIGKALCPISAGQGLIPILVTLQ